MTKNRQKLKKATISSYNRWKIFKTGMSESASGSGFLISLDRDPDPVFKFLRGGIRIRFFLRGCIGIPIRSISDRIRNPGHLYPPPPSFSTHPSACLSILLLVCFYCILEYSTLYYIRWTHKKRRYLI